LRGKIGGEKVIKIRKTKTAAKKERLPKVATDAVQISPSQFVMENQGIFSESYKFVKQIGQGMCLP
jgi:hypothetical protein